jgi:hypothetical protein
MGKLVLQPMASGHLCLEINNSVTWKDFPQFAEKLVSALGGNILDKTESVDMRMWKVSFPRCEVRLVYDDFPLGVTLESMSDDGDQFLRDLKKKVESKSC